MALSQDKPRDYKWIDGRPTTSQPVQASVVSYIGGAQSRSTGGEVGPLAAGEAFAGFAAVTTDNSTGSDGEVTTKLYAKGIVLLTVTGVDDNDDIADTVYATDDDTFTLTASGGVAIGKVFEIEDLSSNQAWVYFEADTVQSI